MLAKRGDWVQVYRQVLPVGERAPQVPEDTKAVPLELWVKGFLEQAEGKVGQDVLVKTVTGRLVTGEMTAVLPRYAHDFGEPQPELLKIGLELRAMLKEGGKIG